MAKYLLQIAVLLVGFADMWPWTCSNRRQLTHWSNSIGEFDLYPGILFVMLRCGNTN
jgi:hypothetical protein